VANGPQSLRAGRPLLQPSGAVIPDSMGFPVGD